MSMNVKDLFHTVKVRQRKSRLTLIPFTLLLICARPGVAADADTSSAALKELVAAASDSESLERFLQTESASIALTADDATAASTVIRDAAADRLRTGRADEMKRQSLKLGPHEMRFFHRTFGKKPDDGWSLYISMHGGGGVPARVNDGQWENQKRLYQLDEGIYVAPRAPTNTWNLWHQGHIDGLFERLITNFIVFEDVNPDRVYLTGYSAGGDGVYQLAPRMADQFASAAMMAGHPNETSPAGLRNLPFTIHVGEKDAGYRRNAVAQDWQKKLADLRAKDPDGYPHHVEIHKGKGHWMDRQDAVALKWMAEFKRNRHPQRIVWKQDDVTHDRFYWLSVEPADVKARGQIVASRDGQTINIETEDASGVTVLLNDDVVDLDKEVVILANGVERFHGTVPRTIADLASSIRDRGGLADAFSAKVTVSIAN